MKLELSTDLGTHNKHLNTPLFHRIKFKNASVYLTKATSYDLITSRNDSGDYRIFSWTDYRSKTFLGFELGQESPALGPADLIGMFSPVGKNLTKVKYLSNKGKAYFKNAEAVLSGEEIFDPFAKIDVDNFMKMEEIIPTGRQGKAIYGEGNYIIDGPAGTGKSTTVLQKIKLLQLHDNVVSDKICVVVKNNKVVNNFRGLLRSIGVENIEIVSAEDFIHNEHGATTGLNKKKLVAVYNTIESIVQQLNTASKLSKLTEIQLSGDYKAIEAPLLTMVGSEVFCDLSIELINKVRIYRNKKDNIDKSYSEKNKTLSRYLVRFEHGCKDKQIKANIKRILREKGEVTLGELSLGQITTIKVLVNDEAKPKKAAIQGDRRDSLEGIEPDFKSLENIRKRLLEEFCSRDSLEYYFDIDDIKLAKLHVNKYFSTHHSFHTIIIDEAQDVPAESIELIRLYCENIILAGDESQIENENGVGLWSSLLHVDKVFSNSDGLNIFNLRHNFRQTYELGSVSYNYRQLLLGRELNDIKEDYFDDQIGFTKPELVLIGKGSDFNQLVKERLQYIRDEFTKPFPLVIFYENNKSLVRFKDLISQNSYKVSVDDFENDSSDILFIATNEIAGREFPVVIAPLANVTNPNTIYVMLSRAKFSLSLVTGVGKTVDENILKLCERGIINKVN